MSQVQGLKTPMLPTARCKQWTFDVDGLGNLFQVSAEALENAFGSLLEAVRGFISCSVYSYECPLETVLLCQ